MRRRFARRVRSDLIPKIENSAMTVSLVMEGEPDVKFAIELGFTIMVDKPLVAVVPAGRPIPEKLAHVVDLFIEDPGDPKILAERIKEAMLEMRRRGLTD